MDKVVFFAFVGEALCFNHVLINALDMYEQGIEVKIVLEGQSVKLLQEFDESSSLVYKQVREANLIVAICKACSAKLGVLEYNEKSGIPLVGDMKVHPPMAPYIKAGYKIITI
ncbi:MAG: cytoplasmic protein [Firmicutes bacterium]|nr:cytoplasmic protein [Bacillota bacterium]